MSDNNSRSLADREGLTYRDAGVDVDAGNALAEWIGNQVRGIARPEVVGGIGAFAGISRLPAGVDRPLLVAATDGVGTKLKVAFAAGRHDTVGVDLVAMNVNDVITCGAEPLFFLDYFASGKLEPEVAKQVLTGIIEGCRQARCSLLGGETAEMPGMYPAGEYDLAGFVVGVVGEDRIIDGSRVEAGDAVIGLPSSGLHSNGFSLARRALDVDGADLAAPVAALGRSLADALLEPTRIYVDAVARLRAAVDVHALVHITGGGLIDNPPRCLRGRLGFRLEQSPMDRAAHLRVDRGPGQDQARGDAAHLQHGARYAGGGRPGRGRRRAGGAGRRVGHRRR